MFDWAGYFGVAVYLGSYVGLQLGFIPGVGYRYATLNMLAALLVLVSLLQAFNMASAIIQISWILISVVGITRTYLISRRLFFTEEEQTLLRDGLPGTPKEIARKFLDAGLWMDADRGVVVTTQGAPVKQLYLLVSGAASVRVDGKDVATLQEGFIGEMNIMEQGPASATVEISEPSRLFCIAGDNLRRLVRSDAEASIHIERHLGTATKRKLLQANQRMSVSH